MKIMSFSVDTKSRNALNKLREDMNCNSNADVIRRALTLISLAVNTAKNDGQVILRGKDGTEQEIDMGVRI